LRRLPNTSTFVPNDRSQCLLCLTHHAVRLWIPRRWPRGATNPVQIHWNCARFLPSFQGRWPSLIRRNPSLQQTASLCNPNLLSVWSGCCLETQHTAAHCKTLQCTASHCITPQPKTSRPVELLSSTATHCNALQHTAAHCNALQQIASHCNPKLLGVQSGYL